MFNIDKLTQLAGKPIIKTVDFPCHSSYIWCVFKFHKKYHRKIRVPFLAVVPKYYPILPYTTIIYNPCIYFIIYVVYVGIYLGLYIYIYVVYVGIYLGYSPKGIPNFSPLKKIPLTILREPRCIILPEEKVRRFDVTMNTWGVCLPTDTGWLIGILIIWFTIIRI